MIRSLLVTLAVIPLLVNALPLTDFSEVVKAVEEGHGLRAVMNFEQCSFNGNQVNSMIGSISVKSIIIRKDKFITFSDLHFTTHHPGYQGKPVYENTKFVLTNKGNLEVHSEVLNAINYDVLASYYKFNCQLGKGAHLYSV